MKPSYDEYLGSCTLVLSNSWAGLLIQPEAVLAILISVDKNRTISTPKYLIICVGVTYCMYFSRACDTTDIITI